MTPSYLNELEIILRKSAPDGADFCIIRETSDSKEGNAVVSITNKNHTAVVYTLFSLDGWLVWWRNDKDLYTSSKKNTRRNQIKLYRIQDVADYVLEFFEELS